MKICKKHNVPVLEDTAEALGTTYKGKYLGTYGKCAALSFNGNKIITTTGGGMLISDDEKIIDKVRFWSTQSKEPEKHYEHKELGYNYRMSNVLAGIGRGQMRVLEDRIAKKREIFDTYKKVFENIEEIEITDEEKEERSNRWLTTILLKQNSKIKPLDIIETLEKENIEARRVWKPMHLQPVFKKYKLISINEENNKISVSEDLFNRGICLPSDTKMTQDENIQIGKIVKNV